jgi:hypothetical protein
VSLSPAVEEIINPIDVANKADTNGCPSEYDGDGGDNSHDDMAADIIEEYNVDLEDEDKKRLVIGGVTGCKLFKDQMILSVTKTTLISVDFATKSSNMSLTWTRTRLSYCQRRQIF